MSATLEIDRKEMHDIKSAASLTGYSRDHIATLARTQKIVAAQIDRHWYIDVESLEQYSKITALEQEVKQKHLSEERRSTRTASESLKKRTKRKANHAAAYQRKLHASLASFVFLLGVATAGMSHFAPALLAPSERQLASTKVPVALSLDNLMAPERLMIPETKTTFSDGAVSVSSLASQTDAIVILPQNLATSTDVFSDAVVAETGNGSTTLRMVETGRVLPLNVVTVPITENSNL